MTQLWAYKDFMQVLPYQHHDLHRVNIHLFKICWILLLTGLIANLLYGASEGVLIYLVKNLLDQGFIDRNQLFIALLPIHLTGIFVIRAIAAGITEYCLSKATRQAIDHLLTTLVQGSFAYPLSLLASEKGMSYPKEFSSASEKVVQQHVELFRILSRELASVLCIIGMMLVISPLLTTLCLSSAPLYLMVAKTVRYHLAKLREQSHQAQDLVAGDIQQLLKEGIQMLIRACGSQASEQKRFTQDLEHAYELEMQKNLIVAIGTSALQVIIGIAVTSMIYLAINFRYEHFTGGEFVAFLTGVIALLRPIKQLGTVMKISKEIADANRSLEELKGGRSVSPQLQPQAAALAQDFNEDHHSSIEQDVNEDLHSSIALNQDALKNHQPRPLHAAFDIVFKDVGFAYADRTVLHGVSFHIPAGTKASFSGPSGTGKSTIGKLLLGFLSGYQGEILLADVLLSDDTLAFFREHIAYVNQQDHFFLGRSLADNIAYPEQPNMARLMAAAQQADAHDFIIALKDGYQTIYGKGGFILSGGQQRRLALARAFYSNKPVLVFDEPTAQLDEKAAQDVMKTISSIQGKTCFIFTHDRLLMQRCDLQLALTKINGLTQLDSLSVELDKQG